MEKKIKDKAADKKASGKAAKMNAGGLGKYMRETFGEVKRLQWPSGKELVMYSLMVIAFIAVVAAFIAALDGLFGLGFKLLSSINA